MSDPVIKVENLGKKYLIGHQQHHGSYTALRDVIAESAKGFARRLVNLTNGRSRSHGSGNKEEIWALKDVSFEVGRGEVIGIIGRNGAGKSTLLKILSRITEPTEGRVRIRGRVGSLLEVGTGFHPELTGRENIYLNGAILGMTRAEIKRKFDEIVAFAEIEKFLDTPVKRYSSGMYVRLAFAVAAHLEPEILLVDEVLAVGDAAFQKKCLGKMDEVAKEGRTVLFVSHNMGAIRKLCPFSLLLDSGKLRVLGGSQDVIEQYLAEVYPSFASIQFVSKKNTKGYIKRVRLLDDRGEETSRFPCGTEPRVEITFVINERVRGCHVACIVNTNDGHHLFSTADTDADPTLFNERLPGVYVVQVQLPTRTLNTGTYHISVGLGIPGIQSFDRKDAVSFTIYDAGDFGTLKEGSRRAGLLLLRLPWKYLRYGHKGGERDKSIVS